MEQQPQAGPLRPGQRPPTGRALGTGLLQCSATDTLTAVHGGAVPRVPGVKRQPWPLPARCQELPHPGWNEKLPPNEPPSLIQVED